MRAWSVYLTIVGSITGLSYYAGLDGAFTMSLQSALIGGVVLGVYYMVKKIRKKKLQSSFKTTHINLGQAQIKLVKISKDSNQEMLESRLKPESTIQP